MGTFHRHNDYHNVQTVYYTPNPKPTSIIENFLNFYVFKEHHFVLLSTIRPFPHGDQNMSSDSDMDRHADVYKHAHPYYV